MPGISIHVVDVSRGVIAAGMRVELHSRNEVVANGQIGTTGLLEHSALKERFGAGPYQAVFHVADYYRKEGVVLPSHPFLDVVRYDFAIDQPDQHYHLPFKCTPWGYSCFRGGA
ncbi:MAG TPA: hydroxyisourate hydrolase [Burkholderiales bacterium]|nr:hydroxyisourate hydrolase [Burkholderiales bacterium]